MKNNYQPNAYSKPTSISDDGMNLIKASEGLRLKAYLCPAGVATIGYGHIKNVSIGQEITSEKADAFLLKDLGWAEDAVMRLVKVSIWQHQFDALVSFVFNLGVGNFRKSTLLKLLNKQDIEGAAKQFPRWCKARVSGKLVSLRGLVIRRNAEMMLFNGHGVKIEANDNEPIAQRVVVPMGKGIRKTLVTSKTVKTGGAIIGGSGFGLNEVLAKSQDAAAKVTELKDTVGAFDFLGDNIPVLLLGFAIGLGAFLIYNRIRDMQKGLAA